MKIAVVSDTHSFDLPQKFLKDLNNVDYIIHAGDICDVKVLKQLEKIKPVVAVYGNMDEAPIKKILPRRRIVDLGGVLVGVCHGLGKDRDAYINAQDEFKRDKVQVVVFGHSHQPLNEQKGNVLYFNPGSPNDFVKAPYCSYGMIEIKGGRITATIIKV